MGYPHLYIYITNLKYPAKLRKVLSWLVYMVVNNPVIVLPEIIVRIRITIMIEHNHN